MDVEELLVGPRGRRLCLQWVYWLAEEQAQEGFGSLESDINRAAGPFEEPVTTTFPLSTRVSPRPGSGTLPTPVDIARRIMQLQVREPTHREALTLLADTASFAMYWQAPWGEDALAATDPVRASLRPIAEALVAAAAAQWWDGPADLCSQWSVQESRSAEPGAGAEPPAENAAEILRASEELVGQWWSTPPHRLSHSTRYLDGLGPVGMWVEEDGTDPQYQVATRIDPPTTPRVLEISGPEDWTRLCREFPLDVTMSRDGVWPAATGCAGPWTLPDWSAVAESGIDAVHLTVRGYLTTAGRALPSCGHRRAEGTRRHAITAAAVVMRAAAAAVTCMPLVNASRAICAAGESASSTWRALAR